MHIILITSSVCGWWGFYSPPYLSVHYDDMNERADGMNEMAETLLSATSSKFDDGACFSLGRRRWGMDTHISGRLMSAVAYHLVA